VVTPLLKKGDKTNVSNYRPISVLSSFSKIIEKVVYKQLLDHLIEHDILANEQFGFRPDSSTDKAIYKLTHEILNSLNNKLEVGGIFFDLEKAFDSLNHNILLSKMQFYGIKNVSQAFFTSYLRDRYMRVRVPSDDSSQVEVSTWERVTDGVPQGSVLGPLLFLLYINDLPKILNKGNVPVLFADDTSLIVKSASVKELQDEMIAAVATAYTWFKTNLLSVNINKTHYIQFKTKNKPTSDMQIICNDHALLSVSHCKFLGIHIQDTLNWSCHINSIIPKLSSACYIMRNLKPIMLFNTLKTVYYSHFNSILSYGLPFWGNSCHSIKIFRLQKKIIRIMTGTKKMTSCRNLFKKLGILPLASQYILALMILVNRNKHWFTLNSVNHAVGTRQKHNFYQPIATLTVYQKGMYYMGIKIFNNLPLCIKETLDNTKKFEACMKSFLCLHSFYSLEEFFNFQS
jgi:hypothetical protein